MGFRDTGNLPFYFQGYYPFYFPGYGILCSIFAFMDIEYLRKIIMGIFASL